MVAEIKDQAGGSQKTGTVIASDKLAPSLSVGDVAASNEKVTITATVDEKAASGDGHGQLPEGKCRRRHRSNRTGLTRKPSPSSATDASLLVWEAKLDTDDIKGTNIGVSGLINCGRHGHRLPRVTATRRGWPTPRGTDNKAGTFDAKAKHLRVRQPAQRRRERCGQHIHPHPGADGGGPPRQRTVTRSSR